VRSTVNTSLGLTGQTRINPYTGKPAYYKDKKQTHDINNAGRMWVAGKYISKLHPLHKPGRYKSWDDAHSHQQLDTVVEGHVYVISNRAWPAWVKIGMAVDAEDRCKGYQTSCPFRDYKLVHSIHATDRRKAEKLAHTLASKEAEERRGEWFKLPVNSAVSIIKQLHECN
jgi:hypothetical protein